MAGSDERISRRLYISHFLSAWNSRMFEFGAVLFLASIYPGTLLYTSIYALIRSASSVLFSARVGACIDEMNRLHSMRHSIILQRAAVIISCALFLLIRMNDWHSSVTLTLFGIMTLLACVEKLASLGSTIALEKDWVIVVCDASNLERSSLNAILRRIDLFCKLVAPVVVSLIDATGKLSGILTVLLMSSLSIVIEYMAIAQVYEAVPELARRGRDGVELGFMPEDEMDESPQTTDSRLSGAFISQSAMKTWMSYFASPVFLASLALSLSYLTVLSTNVHWQTYMLAISFTPLSVSLLRLCAVVSELAATGLAPLLMARIGSTRTGLWSVNLQIATLGPSVFAFSRLQTVDAKLAGAWLTCGLIISRLGLWGLDLSVQLLVQDHAPVDRRSAFSSCEVALQSFFELLSFAFTIAFPRPEQFVYPVWASYGAILAAAICFAAFVKKDRGHLVHMGRCFGEDKARGYVAVDEGVDM